MVTAATQPASIGYDAPTRPDLAPSEQPVDAYADDDGDDRQ